MGRHSAPPRKPREWPLLDLIRDAWDGDEWPSVIGVTALFLAVLAGVFGTMTTLFSG